MFKIKYQKIILSIIIFLLINFNLFSQNINEFQNINGNIYKQKVNPSVSNLDSNQNNNLSYGFKAGINKSEFFFSTFIAERQIPKDEFLVGMFLNYDFQKGNHFQLEILFSKKRQDFDNENIIKSLDPKFSTIESYYPNSIEMTMIEIPTLYIIETLNLKYITHTIYAGHFISINLVNNISYTTISNENNQLIRTENIKRFDFSNDMGLCLGTQFMFNYIDTHFIADLRFNVPYLANNNVKLDIISREYQINYFNTSISFGIMF